MLTYICSSIEAGSIKRGANPVRVYNSCPHEKDNEDI